MEEEIEELKEVIQEAYDLLEKLAPYIEDEKLLKEIEEWKRTAELHL